MLSLSLSLLLMLGLLLRLGIVYWWRPGGVRLILLRLGAVRWRRLVVSPRRPSERFLGRIVSSLLHPLSPR